MFTEIAPHLQQEMLSKMGRNLLRFQLIETGLKVMLPFAHPGGAMEGLDAYSVLKEEVKNATLGGLRSKLLEAIKTDDPERISNYLNEVVRCRNEFIHHFLQQPGISLQSSDGYRSAISYLDRQFEFAEMLFQLVTQMNVALFTSDSTEVAELSGGTSDI